MVSRLNPYINFNGDARQAMEFYQNVFGGELTMNTFGELGGSEGEGADNIMHAVLESSSGFVLMGADVPPGEEARSGNNMSVCISGEDATELRGYWEKLTSGGTVSVPLEKQVWGDEFGMCVDQFGIAWMVNIAQTQS